MSETQETASTEYNKLALPLSIEVPKEGKWIIVAIHGSEPEPYRPATNSYHRFSVIDISH